MSEKLALFLNLLVIVAAALFVAIAWPRPSHGDGAFRVSGSTYAGVFVGRGLRCGWVTGLGSMARAVSISCVPALEQGALEVR